MLLGFLDAIPKNICSSKSLSTHGSVILGIAGNLVSAYFCSKHLSPMKQLDLVYSPEDDAETLLFTNLDLGKLVSPLTMSREEPVQEEEQAYEKKKSELVDYENEEYTTLRDREQEPIVITDVDSRSVAGKFQSVSDGSSMYFAFINTGTSLRMVPISKWYGFVQRNQFSEGDVEGLEKNLNFAEAESRESESEREIDFYQAFDDDDDDANEIYVSREKTLSSSGKKIKGLMECYEESDKPAEEEREDVTVREEPAKKQRQEKMLTKEDIRKAFGGRKISVKDLLLNIKSHFKMDIYEKNLIREFIHESCVFEIEPATGEKIFKLKK